MVSERNVLPLEIHCLNSDTKKRCRGGWLQDRHVQEIVQLLHDVIPVYVESVANKKQTKQQPTMAADIVTGTSVRVGYTFKRRPHSQHCLLPSQCLTTTAQQQQEDDGLVNLNVLKDKLVVYAHQLVPGSPRGMSQLRKVLGEVNQSGSQAVSISSYFQKLPSSQNAAQLGSPLTVPSAGKSSGNQASSDNQSEENSQSVETVRSLQGLVTQSAVVTNETEKQSSLPGTPPSEGRKSKIKSILQRGDIGPTKRKRRHTPPVQTTTRNSSNTHDLGTQSGAAQRMPEDLLPGDNVTIRKVSNPPVPRLDDDQSSSDCVTEVRVAQVQGMQNSSKNDASMETGKSISNDIKSYISLDDNKSYDEIDDLLDDRKAYDLNTEDLLVDKGSGNVDKPQSELRDDVNEADLKQSGIVPHKTVDQILTDSADGNSEDSPKFRTKKLEKKKFSSCVDKTESTAVPNVECKEKDIKTTDSNLSQDQANTKNLKRFRFKRKVTKFLDSDSDDCFPKKKVPNVSDSKSNECLPKSNVPNFSDSKSADSFPQNNVPNVSDSKSNECLPKSNVPNFSDSKSADSFPKNNVPNVSDSKSNDGLLKNKIPNFSDSKFADSFPKKKVPNCSDSKANECVPKNKIPNFSDSESDDCLPVIKLTKSRRTQRQIGKPLKRCSNRQSKSDNVEKLAKPDVGQTNTETSSKSDGIATNSKSDIETCVKSDKREVHVDEINTNVVSNDANTSAKYGQTKTHSKSASSDSNFVKVDKITAKSKRLNISKSFFTEDDNKLQPKLSFFMNKDGKAAKGSGKDRRKQPTQDEENDVRNKEQVLDLTSEPVVKNEMDVELKNEIRSLSSITELNDDHLRYLVRVNQKYLRAIFEGREPCERHQMYKEGGKCRRNLIHQSRLGHYTEEQIDVVMESLIAMFCKRHEKYLDYLLKVLLPEILIHIHSEVHGMSHAESEGQLAPWSVSNEDENALLDGGMDDF